MCTACGAADGFEDHVAVGRALARQWRLSRDQRAAMNIQQGNACRACGNNLRGRALADALVRRLGGGPPLLGIWDRVPATAVLEINPAARLTPMLTGAHRHVLTAFPDVDMHELPFGDGEFDLVVHSDTLEHVADPVRATRECLRVAGSGWVIFTTPVIGDRLTRDRSGLPASYHGGDSGPSRVWWEFGYDIVGLLMESGATQVEFSAHVHPYAYAISCRRPAQ
jgi:SAM-dependent methyltransferase